MDKKTKAPETKTNETLPEVMINGQYVKDLSFESPSSPASFVPQKEAPQISVALNLEVKEIQNSVYEVIMHISATAKAEEITIFIAEVSYAGLFTLKNIAEEQKEAFLLVHCPTILFPFARRVLADVTRDGGFQPLMIDPVDFAHLYHQRKLNEDAAKDTVN